MPTFVGPPLTGPPPPPAQTDLSNIVGKGSRIIITETTLRPDGLRSVVFEKNSKAPVKLNAWSFNSGLGRFDYVGSKTVRFGSDEFLFPTDQFTIVSYGPAGFRQEVELGVDFPVSEDPEKRISNFNYRQAGRLGDILI